ncbi:unnamed protein product [Albugo candida]|uniref:Phosphomannomutase n=1 Tax=Albugo candida TaxID=65357 RepID=A0A024GVV4_9STRA|nr:unnamed protein product [Albugo candida]|eukprot:CCI50594.1 unnamed protein product [Albugo candida]
MAEEANPSNLFECQAISESQSFKENKQSDEKDIENAIHSEMPSTLAKKTLGREDFDQRRRSTVIPFDISSFNSSRKAFTRANTSGVNRFRNKDDASESLCADGRSSNGVTKVQLQSSDGSTEHVSTDKGPPWKHLILKMTAATDEDLITSFRFTDKGGGIGRDTENIASIPADKSLANRDHALILHREDRFFLRNGNNQSGTYVRLTPCMMEEEKLQWPLLRDCSFRCGKSDFVVLSHDENAQTLELEAVSGKLAGAKFSIDCHGGGIGRSTENVIHTGDGELSRKHAKIIFDDPTARFYLYDLESTNGTYMRLCGPYDLPFRLESGDDLLISQTCLSVTHFDYGVHENMGARKYMEDTHTVIQDLHIECLTELGWHPQSYFGVFDGHGGVQASSFMEEQLHVTIVGEFYRHRNVYETKAPDAASAVISNLVKKQIVAAFERTDKDFLKKSDRPQAGSTGTTVFIAGKRLFVANVGDSRTILSRSGEAVPLSNDHKPNRPDEAQRIRDIGGFVIHGRIMGELAVSRAFGDAPFKILDTPSEPLIASGDANIGSTLQKADVDSQLTINPSDILKGPLVICTPEITETHLTDEEEFLVLASDGLFDVLADQEVVDFVRAKLLQSRDVQRTTEALVQHAIVHQRSTDNVTAIICVQWILGLFFVMNKQNSRILALFDVDGTLTPARKTATNEMRERLRRLKSQITIGVVGGSDLCKQKEQLGEDVVNEFDYSFSENGLVAYHNGSLIGEKNLRDEYTDAQLNRFLDYVLMYIASSQIPVKR